MTPDQNNGKAHAEARQSVEDEEDLHEVGRAANELHVGGDEVLRGFEAACPKRRTDCTDDAGQQDCNAADQ